MDETMSIKNLFFSILTFPFRTASIRRRCKGMDNPVFQSCIFLHKCLYLEEELFIFSPQPARINDRLFIEPFLRERVRQSKSLFSQVNFNHASFRAFSSPTACY